MKTILLTTTIATILLCSCTVHKFRAEQERMLIDNKASLVIKENGDTVRYKSISLPSNMNAHVRWIKLDGQKIEPLAQVNIPGMAARLQDNKAAYARFVQQFGNHPRKVFATDLSKHPKAVLEAVEFITVGCSVCGVWSNPSLTADIYFSR